MIFRRRDKPALAERLRALVWPRGGWGRGIRYVWARMTRLPDPPHRIARGIWAGVFASFTPLFGAHLGLAAVLAWVLRGNVIAALLATLVGNPLTFPLIAVASIQLGHMILGNAVDAPPTADILFVFGQAGAEFWANVRAMVTSEPTQWGRLYSFYHWYFLPYLVGGLAPGLFLATAGYLVSLPMITAFRDLRDRRRRERAELKRARPVPLPGQSQTPPV
ncbi:DUF2062 domain-containing protein [Fuscovulum blasticum]|uniref:DUF2062 domain-containing protein n=1 Tax=Fuscovulum blasticum TaxID=1075 RepID=UPI001D1740D8|nr:DUF2062 domain-containing protein [Fuscovulum blasticum]